MKEVIIGHQHFAPADIAGGLVDIAGLDPYDQEVLIIIKKWLEGAPAFSMSTSGTTGAGKQITLTRRQLLASAEQTLHTLGIQRGDTALLCLDVRHIAGLMMIVRAMAGELNLIAMPPSANPFLQLDPLSKIDLVALVPYQAHHIFALYEQYQQIIDGCKAILIGGGSIDAELAEKTSLTPAPVYNTFGMTETASHFALRRLNGNNPSDDYRTLTGTEIGVDRKGLPHCKGAHDRRQTVDH